MYQILGALVHQRRMAKMATDQSVKDKGAAGPKQEMQYAPLTSLESGIDWVTLTCRSEDPRLKKFRSVVHTARDVQTKTTREPQQSWRMRGYHGWSVSGLSWGAREDGDIIVASGPTANVYWKLFHRFSTNVSRLDLQVTILLEEANHDLVNDYYTNRPFDHRPMFTWLQNSGGGQTLYVGSRRSDQFGRIYDKGIESCSGLPQGQLWRYEVEYKSARAKAMAHNLFVTCCARNPARETIQSTIWQWFADRECRPAFRPLPNGDPILVSLKATDESTERKLTWLQLQVRPTVHQLMSFRSRETLHALGLDLLLGLLPEQETD